MRRINDFAEIVLVDFEYHFGTGGPSEGPPIPVAACALELRTGREYRLWCDQLTGGCPPWAHGRDALFVSFNAIAELGCYLALGWAPPPWILDLLIEYRQLQNGVLDKHARRDLVSVLGRYRLPTLNPADKQRWQARILEGEPFSEEERRGILNYCWTDVEALRCLLPAVLPELPTDLDRSLFRGRYTIPATAAMYAGIPTDEALWRQFLNHRERIQLEIIAGHPVYDGTVFKLERFTKWLHDLGMLNSWRRTSEGRLSTDDKTFRRFGRIPEVETLRQIRAVVNQLRKPNFTVRQGRNYYSILPFNAETGRNSTKRCLFQAPASLRGLIRPDPGAGLIYVDYSQQEYYVAAVLSEDPEMLRLYSAGDPYIAFANMAGLVPPGASKHSHPRERETAKTVCLATLYGLGAISMSRKLGISVNRAEDLLAEHLRRFPRVWKWSDEQVLGGYARKRIATRWGWHLTVGSQTNKRTLRNFRVQGTGADIMRLGHTLLYEAGLRVCAPVHDAFLIECRETNLEETAQEALRILTVAGELVLGTSGLRAEVRVLRPLERLIEERGEAMWHRVCGIVNRLSGNPLKTL